MTELRIANLFLFVCFQRFSSGLDTYANAFSRTLTHSWPYIIVFVEGLSLP